MGYFLRQIDCEIEKMELPHLGTHCIFCTQHGYSPDSHACPNKHLIKNLKVEVCAKCKKRKHPNRPCELKQKRKCSVANCKSKILLPITCSTCGQSVCPRHRFPSDHCCMPTISGESRLVTAY